MANSEDICCPKFTYWHVWTDSNGVSHQTLCELTKFAQESMGVNTAPQWNNRFFDGQTKILFSELPVGWQGDWHENPQPQWIIPLSGRWFVETMDGDRVEMGPGVISFGGDQNTKPDKDGRKGHLSGTVGSEPARLIIVQLIGENWKNVKPGDFA